MDAETLDQTGEINTGAGAPADGAGESTEPENQDFESRFGKKGERLPANLRHKLKDLLRKAQERDLFARREELKRVQKNRFFELGMQHLVWDEDAGIFQVGQQGGGALGEADEDDGPLYQRDIQLYLSYELSFRSVFCQNRPSLRFKPRDPKDAMDITAAKNAEPAKRLIEDSNHPESLQDDVGRLLWTDGTAIAKTSYVRDGQRFGWEDEDEEEAAAVGSGAAGPAAEAGGNYGSAGSVDASANAGAAGEGENAEADTGPDREAKGREVIEIDGVLEWKRPLSIRDPHRWPYAIRSKEDDIATVKAEFPGIESKITSGAKAAGNEHYARLARITCSQGASWYGTAGATLEHLVTVDRAWFRPSWFTEVGDKEDADRKELEEIFPEGCHVVFASGEYAEAYPESMEDHVKVLQAMRANGQNVPGTGNRLVDPAEAFDDMWNMSEECFKFTIPAKIFRQGILDLDAINEQKSRYGGYYEAKDQGNPDRPFGDNFFEETPVSLPEAMPQMMSDVQGPLMQQLSGQLAPLMGQSDEHNETAKGITILRDQALGLMSMVWTPFTIFYGEVMVDAIRCAAENRDQEQPFAAMLDVPGKKGRQELVSVNVQDLQGNIMVARPEVDSNFPESWSAKSNRFFQIFQQAGQNPILLKLLNHPDNHALFKDLMGLEDFEDPDADSRDKQIQEIAELVKGQPTPPDPEQVKQAILAEVAKFKIATAAALATGQPAPPEPNLQVLEQQLTLKLTTSSVQIDPETDNNAVEAAECLRWINSPEGQRMKRGTDEEKQGFANVRLHWSEHDQAAKAQMAQMAAAAAGAGAPGAGAATAA